ncbi:MAG TPA: DUF2784 domain-containing protein [Steroidobacteraceae bacterium]|nr:DUF2784 domain-containing protein [Steroidobacteraceae bacterium]
MLLSRVLVDLVLLVHGAFALFVVLGGWLVRRWRLLAWLHLPCAAWGATVELTGWLCPLTGLENTLRVAAGETPYSGDFLQHYLTSALYPAALTRSMQLGLAALVVLINLAAYGRLWRGRGHRGRGHRAR